MFCYLIVMGCILSGCGTINENIISTPSEADIYWGKTKDNLKHTDHKTPFYRSFTGSDIESWCYQARKNGYYPSEIICRPKETEDRNVNLILRPIEKIQSSVSVTGSAIAVKRITTGGFEEHNPRLSPDKKWLLVEASGDDTKLIKRSVLEKINLYTNCKSHPYISGQ